MSAENPRPLSDARFRGEPRDYQAAVLDALGREDWRGGCGEGDRSFHLVAPPGSGKTILGLLLAVRDGRRALILAPTSVIRDQWANTARERFGIGEGAAEDPQMLVDSDEVGDLNIMTYQRLSVVDSSSPFADAAREQWIEEMERSWSDRERALAWLEELQYSNPKEYSKGIRSRANAIRKNLRSLDPRVLEQTLHPRALALIEGLVRAGVRTIVLDECHHLLDHWALVLHLLRSKIEEAGGDPLLIGLTATPPDPASPAEERNYTGLLGEVDYEVPTPAVIRAGDLAPVRTWAWFTRATPKERRFIERHERMLEGALAGVFAAPEGLAFLHECLIAPEPDPEDEGGATPLSLDERMRRAFDSDPFLALAAGRMLVRLDEEGAAIDPEIIRRLPDTTAPSLDDRLLLLARHALTRLLPDEGRAQEWRERKRLLLAFGYHLTDRGIRRGKDPIDAVLSRSESKDRAVLDILALENESLGESLRAAVVADLAQHDDRSALAGAQGSGTARGGALRCFTLLSADPLARSMHPVLITASHLRLLAEDVEVLDALRTRTCAPLAVTRISGEVAEIATVGTTPSRLVRALAELVEEGIVRLVVGTRGLLAEGWDCPSLNTLIDLTTVTTSTAAQQLHGRTLRLDPAWPGKAAHNWIIACLPSSNSLVPDSREYARLRIKAEHLWGPSRDAADPEGTITRGIDAILDPVQREILSAPSPLKDPVRDLNERTRKAIPPRAESHRLWHLGTTVSARIRSGVKLREDARFAFESSNTPLSVLLGAVALLLSAVAFAVSVLVRMGPAQGLPAPFVLIALLVLTALFLLFGIGIPALKETLFLWRTRSHPVALYHRGARAVLQALQDSGSVSGAIDPASILVEEGSRLRIEFSAGSASEKALLHQCLAELFTPIGLGRPRHIIILGPMPEIERSSPAHLPGPLRWSLDLGIVLVNAAMSSRSHYLAVPAALGTTKEAAMRFESAWNRAVGPARVVDLRMRANSSILVAARAQNRGGIRTNARIVEHWA
ncbi:MAG: DEAD/DEAH box helicase family protein [Schaalia hyovaginalis]|uniref:DEAD/DEAH box helicase family protein n=1 Tax=Schaalia hyovaginalis TaxID=29316 RepID=UPI0023FA0F7B|nr:DEAD/DEAH box helicase family protein [Schaalia hyovaginalis]MCI7671496.1 DEAD/DEAH box helicase family protein [Schaalia hyovaginalis]MDY5505245.1 DEAD/DEAH box helicase family protein [Schaalia hyovaginalis]